MKHVRCENCKKPQRVEEEVLECIYCGRDISQSDIITERIWREYWEGILGQPSGGYRDIKPSTQAVLPKEEKKRKNYEILIQNPHAIAHQINTSAEEVKKIIEGRK